MAVNVSSRTSMGSRLLSEVSAEDWAEKQSWIVRAHQFSCSVKSDSATQRTAGLPRPSPTSRACLNSCPSSQWCRPTISSFLIPFSSCPKPFPSSGSFQLSQLFASGGQSIGIQLQCQSFQWILRVYFLKIDWFDLLAVQGTLKSLLQHQI